VQKTTIGRLLLNDVLPAGYQINDTTPKKALNEKMVALAKSDPKLYVDVIGKLKKVGDAVTTDSGITVGLDDIEPDYVERDSILEPALIQIKKTRDINKRKALIDATQQQLLQSTRKHPGQMTTMALSGARGSLAQLMRTVGSSVAVVDDQGQTIPWMISKSYAEGLKAPDAWVAMSEARRNAVETYTSVAAPGEMSKILVNNMSDQLITMPDCKTKNGVLIPITEAQDRFDAQTGELITAAVIRNRTTRQENPVIIKVRSPMTCEAPDGVCQKCYGLNTRGQVPTLGTNVGMMAAHAMGEPLTQMALNAKHATRTSQSQRAVLDGMAGFKQLTEIPQSFFNKATLATQAGNIEQIKKAPQGGHYVFVNKHEHYVPPNLDVRVKKDQIVEAGDVLSDGIAKPDELVRYKGLGTGRQYLVDQLHGLYNRQGLDMDRRHFEILAKTDLNYIRMLDKDSPSLGMIRGDVVDYNRFRRLLAQKSKVVPIDAAQGRFLGDNVLHHTAGTPLTAALVKELRQQGITQVPTAPEVPQHEAVMKPMSRTPLLHPDLLGRLGHRNLKNTILEGAAFGEMSNIHGTHPVPAFVFGEQFGQGPQGRY